ncbi:MAG: SpaA isopeptide-forming pilin-related protein [Acutalibacteraceae bacterium]
MKKSKKFLKVLSATAIAAIMATSMMSTVAFAAVTLAEANGNLQIETSKGLQEGDKITYYKVATLKSVGGYEWSWDDVFKTGVKETLPDLDSVVSTYTSNSAEVKQLAAKLARNITATGTEVNYDKDAGNTISSLAEGYYLIKVTSGTKSDVVYQPILLQVTNDNTAAAPAKLASVKSEPIEFKKEITSVTQIGTGSTSNEDVAQVKIGDTINYKLTAQIPNYDPAILTSIENNTTADDGVTYVPFTIADTPVNQTIVTGDDFANVVVKLGTTTLTKGTDYEITGDETGISIVIDPSVILTDVKNNDTDADVADGIADNSGKMIYVEFGANLTNGATVEGAGNDNNATLTYGNDYSTGGLSKTKKDDTTVYTTALKITKKDTNKDGRALSGATFDLTQDDTSFKMTKTTGEDGTLTFNGLSAGTYKLVETAAPAGYKLDTTVYTIKIDAALSLVGTDKADRSVEFTTTTSNVDHNDTGFSTEIYNTPGQELPGTGGVGTTMFTIGGIALVVVAGAMLTIYMKRRRTAE